MKVTKRIYRIPLLIRKLSLRSFIIAKHKVMILDGVPFFYYYDNEDDLKPDLIRRCLSLISETHCFIEANNQLHALKRFYNEWDGAREKALWVDKSQKIIKELYCKLRHRNKNSEYMCGKITEDVNGEFGGCVLEGYDKPDGYCPYK